MRCELILPGLVSLVTLSTADGRQELMPDDGTLEATVFDPGEPPHLSGHQKGSRENPQSIPPEPTSSDEPREWFDELAWTHWSRASGDWNGVRTQLEDAGISFDASYTFDLINLFSGGADDDGTRWHSLFDSNLTFDLETIFGWKGATVYVDFYSTNHDVDEGNVGDAQGVSVIATDEKVDSLVEAWLELQLMEGFLRVKAGKIEANAEFAFLSAAAEVVHVSGIWSPTHTAMPTYPNPATGIVAFIYPTDTFYLGAGFFDGSGAVDGFPTGSRGPKEFFDDDVSDDYYLIGEAGLTWTASNAHAGRAAVGLSHHTGEWTNADGDPEEGNETFYALIEQRLCHGLDDENDEQGLFGYAQVGACDGSVNQYEFHVGCGLEYQGVCGVRPDDAVGVFASFVALDEEWGYDADELALEGHYRLNLTPSLIIRPALQYVVNPGGSDAADDAFVGHLRFEITF